MTSTSIQMIPLNQLVPSPRNVRRTDRKADLESLAASIAAHGLLQNLCVVQNDEGKYEVDAGGRRLAALKLLAKGKIIAKDYPVPCQLLPLTDGREASLIENVHRVAMTAMDEVEAFAALTGEGASLEEIAHRFGVTRRHVEQRLALSALSPKIKSAWKRGEVSLEAARAFCLVPDHDKQETVFRSLGRPVTHAASVRARLMEGRMRASDRIATFVGLERYELAGGAIMRDLFDEDAVFIGDPGLMTQLAERKLEDQRVVWLADGWGWVEIMLGHSGRESGYAALRLQPGWRDLNEAEETELARLRSALDALDAALDQDSEENDPRWHKRDTLAAAIETLRQSARVWDKDLIAHAGVILSIDHDGEVSATLGLIRQADEKAIKAIRKKQSALLEGREAFGSEEDDEADVDPVEVGSGSDSSLPRGLIRDLTQARTRAIRLLLANDRETALAVTVAAMIVRVVFRNDLAGISIVVHPAPVEDLDARAEIRSAMLAHVPDEEAGVLGWCLAQPGATLLALLAVLVSDVVDLTHEKGSPIDRRRQAVSDRLAEALDLDMRAFWQADDSYWTRLPKSELLAALSDAPALAGKTVNARDAAMKAYAKLKKDELAAKAGQAFAGTGYLPDVLVTPLAPGSIDVTSAGALAIAAE